MAQKEKTGLVLMIASSTAIIVAVQGNEWIGAAIFLVVFWSGAILFAEKKEEEK